MVLASRVLGRVVSRERVGSMVVQRLSVPGWRAAAPGQFALLQREGSSCFLPRAFSVMSQRDGTVAFLISPVGPGTTELAEARVGEGVWVLGPLGRGFDLVRMLGALPCAVGGRPTTGAPRLLVVAGGVGIAPFPLVLDGLGESVLQGAARTVGEATGRPAVASTAGLESGRPGEDAVVPASVLILLGFRDAAQAAALDLLFGPVAGLRQAGVEVRTEAIAEDGSLGRAGLVTALLADELREGDVLAVCGSHAMCEAVWGLCTAHGRSVAAWFSLEAAMACGVGSCQGCVIPLSDGSLARVCRRGPVFAGDEAFGGVSAGVGAGGGHDDPEAEGW